MKVSLHTVRASIERQATVVRQELLLLFETPIAYIVAVLFLLVSQSLFFRNAFLVREASLREYFSALPWYLLLVVPALTMSIFAQERESGTFESFITKPLTEVQIVLGKFWAILLMLVGVLAVAVVPIAIGFSWIGNLDWGIFVSGCIASVFLAAAFASVGVFVSSLFKKQISALLVTIVAVFFLVLAGSGIIAGSMPIIVNTFLERVSAVTHFVSMMRGAIDVRDVWYFMSVSVAFLALTVHRVRSFRYGRGHRTRTTSFIGTVLIVAIALISNVLGSFIPGRIDLSADKLYTLSPATTERLAQLPDLVTITLYSSDLPAQYSPIVRDVRDLIQDYGRYGRGNVRVQFKQSHGDDAVRDEAINVEGLREIQFNMVGSVELSVKKGFLGVVVTYGSKRRTLPLIDNASALEYDLTSAIADLTATSRKHVSFLRDVSNRTADPLSLFEGELGKMYAVDDVSFDGEKRASASTTPDVLIVTGVTGTSSKDARRYLDSYLAHGGAALVFVDGVSVDTRTLQAEANETDLVPLLSSYGITVEPRLIFDIHNAEVVGIGNGLGIRYPLWFPVAASPESPITSALQTVAIQWGSSLTLNAEALKSRGASAVELLRTSNGAGAQEGTFAIAPDTTFDETQANQYVMGYSMFGTGSSSPRLVVVGSSRFLNDDVVKNSGQNFAFGIGAVSWLAQEGSLASIRAKSGLFRSLAASSERSFPLVSYGTRIVSVIIPCVLGALLYVRRRGLMKHTWHSRPLA